MRQGNQTGALPAVCQKAARFEDLPCPGLRRPVLRPYLLPGAQRGAGTATERAEREERTTTERSIGKKGSESQAPAAPAKAAPPGSPAQSDAGYLGKEIEENH